MSTPSAFKSKIRKRKISNFSDFRFNSEIQGTNTGDIEEENDDNKLSNKHINNEDIHCQGKKEGKVVDGNGLKESKIPFGEELERLKKMIFRICASEISPDLIPYYLIRSKKLTLRGMRTYFNLVRDDVYLYSSKVRSADSVIFISEGKESHFSDNKFRGHITVHDKGLFSLYDASKSVLSVNFFPSHIVSGPRAGRIKFHMELNTVEPVLDAVKPQIISDDVWQMDFRGRRAVKSVKNIIFHDSHQREIVSFMKEKRGTFCIEAVYTMPPIYIFTIGIACCLCKV